MVFGGVGVEGVVGRVDRLAPQSSLRSLGLDFRTIFISCTAVWASAVLTRSKSQPKSKINVRN